MTESADAVAEKNAAAAFVERGWTFASIPKSDKLLATEFLDGFVSRINIYPDSRINYKRSSG